MCYKGGKSINRIESYTCDCKEGFIGEQCGKKRWRLKGVFWWHLLFNCEGFSAKQKLEKRIREVNLTHLFTARAFLFRIHFASLRGCMGFFLFFWTSSFHIFVLFVLCHWLVLLIFRARPSSLQPGFVMRIKPNSVHALTHPLSKMHVTRNFRKSHHPIETLTLEPRDHKPVKNLLLELSTSEIVLLSILLSGDCSFLSFF